jgi:hypothetical protein
MTKYDLLCMRTSLTGCYNEVSLNVVSLNYITGIIDPLCFKTIGQIIPD